MKVLVMKNLSGNKKGNFEKAWQDAFEGKEMTPSPDVWMKVDGHLANQESKKFRKGILFYKWTAAASLLLATGITLFYLYNFNHQSTDSLTNNSQNQVESVTGVDGVENNSKETQNEQLTSENQASIIANDTAEGKNNQTESNASLDAGKNQAAIAGSVPDDTGDNRQLNSTGDAIADNTISTASINDSNAKNNGTNSNRDKSSVIVNQDIDNQLKNQESQSEGRASISVADNSTNNASTVYSDKASDELDAQHLSKLKGQGAGLLTQIEPDQPYYLQKVIIFEDNPFKKDEDDDYDDLWAGVDFASGHFDPNFGSGRSNTNPQSLSNNFSFELNDLENGVADRSIIQRNSGGQSFSFGFNMGKRIAKKWVLQGGVNYLNYTSQGRTNTFYELDNQNRTPAVAEYNVTNAQSLNFASTEIDYDNQFQFLSIPVKAGFVVIDKKFGMIVSAGVGTDFWLRNKISTDGAGLEDFTVTPGSDAPYRKLYFNGLFSTQFKYQITKQYSITLEPAYAIAINSFSKSETSLDSFPNVFNLGIGLKYHFK